MYVIKPLREGHPRSTFDEQTYALSALANSLYWAKTHRVVRLELLNTGEFECYSASDEIVSVADVGNPGESARDMILLALQSKGMLPNGSSSEFSVELTENSFDVSASFVDGQLQFLLR